MLKLRYIVIGSLPEMCRQQLIENLKRDAAKGGDVCLIDLGREEDLCRFETAQSIFISENVQELRAASALSMAVLGYLAPAGGEETAQKTEGDAFAEERQGADVTMWAEGFEEVGLPFLTRVYERHHGLPWTILTTDRCVVKEFSMDYLDALFELYEGEGMTEYIEPLYPYEQEKEYQQAYIRHMYGFYGYGMWIVCDKETGALIGRAGLEHREELNGAIELGYAIGVPYQRKGIATEVCTAILSYAKEELGQSEIYCLIEPENRLSVHFAKKLGFSFAGTEQVGGKEMEKYRKQLNDEKEQGVVQK